MMKQQNLTLLDHYIKELKSKSKRRGAKWLTIVDDNARTSLPHCDRVLLKTTTTTMTMTMTTTTPHPSQKSITIKDDDVAAMSLSRQRFDEKQWKIVQLPLSSCTSSSSSSSSLDDDDDEEDDEDDESEEQDEQERERKNVKEAKQRIQRTRYTASTHRRRPLQGIDSIPRRRFAQQQQQQPVTEKILMEVIELVSATDERRCL